MPFPEFFWNIFTFFPHNLWSYWEKVWLWVQSNHEGSCRLSSVYPHSPDRGLLIERSEWLLFSPLFIGAIVNWILTWEFSVLTQTMPRQSYDFLYDSFFLSPLTSPTVLLNQVYNWIFIISWSLPPNAIVLMNLTAQHFCTVHFVNLLVPLNKENLTLKLAKSKMVFFYH